MTQESELLRIEPALRELVSRVVELEILLTARISAAEEGSDLLSDDSLLEPLRLSSLAQLSLVVAIDHLRAVRLVVDSGIPPVAGFTLLRGAIESAANVIWLLSPNTALLRATRLLRVLQTDASDLGTTINVISEKKTDGSHSTEALRGKAASLGISARLTRVTTSEVLADVQKVLFLRDEADPSDTPLVVTWRLLSAGAHGRGHFFDLFLLSAPDGDVGGSQSTSTRFWAEPKQFETIFGLAIVLSEIAQEIYAERADARVI